jgi:hypothetical protein
VRGASPRRGSQCTKSLNGDRPSATSCFRPLRHLQPVPFRTFYTPAALLTDNLDTYDIDSEIERGVFAKLTWSD